MSSQSGGETIYRVVHHPIPEDWRASENVAVVQELGDTSYLLDNVPRGTSLIVGGFNLGVCVLDHLEALANRQPVIDGRVTVYLSQSNSLSWHPEIDRVQTCSEAELAEVVQTIVSLTGVTIQLVE